MAISSPAPKKMVWDVRRLSIGTFGIYQHLSTGNRCWNLCDLSSVTNLLLIFWQQAESNRTCIFGSVEHRTQSLNNGFWDCRRTKSSKAPEDWKNWQNACFFFLTSLVSSSTDFLKILKTSGDLPDRSLGFFSLKPQAFCWAAYPCSPEDCKVSASWLVLLLAASLWWAHPKSSPTLKQPKSILAYFR